MVAGIYQLTSLKEVCLVSHAHLCVPKTLSALLTESPSDVWIFGSADDDDRNMGMGVVVDYENQSGEPRWVAPPKADWDYTAFGRSGPAAAPDETVKLTFEKIPESAHNDRAAMFCPCRLGLAIQVEEPT
jgi:hypothetical protein